MNTTTLTQTPILSPEKYRDFIEFKAGMERRRAFSFRCEPYEHRPWDRGFDPYEEGGI